MAYKEKYTWSMSGFETKEEADERLVEELAHISKMMFEDGAVISYVQKNAYGLWMCGYEVTVD